MRQQQQQHSRTGLDKAIEQGVSVVTRISSPFNLSEDKSSVVLFTLSSNTEVEAHHISFTNYKSTLTPQIHF